MRNLAILLALLVLAACAAPAVISDISDSALRIQVNALTPPAEIAQRARDGCAIYGKEPVAISSRCVGGNCDYHELLFACRAPSAGSAVTSSVAPTSATTQAPSGIFDGRWVGEGTSDGCGASWAMEISVRNGEAKGLLWRGRAEYNFEGRVSREGKLQKALAGKTPASNGIVGPRFITVNAAFADETANGDYSMAAPGVNTCTAPVTLNRHQA